MSGYDKNPLTSPDRAIRVPLEGNPIYFYNKFYLKDSRKKSGAIMKNTPLLKSREYFLFIHLTNINFR